MPNIFISYSSKDRDFAKHVAYELRKHGADIFIDYQKLEAGNFVKQIGNKIERCDQFIVILSPNSVESQWVQDEVAWALIRNKTIIPLILEVCSMTNLFAVASREQVDFTSWRLNGDINEAIEKLVRLLDLPTNITQGDIVHIFSSDSGKGIEGYSIDILVETPLNKKSEPLKTVEISKTFEGSDLFTLFTSATEMEGENPLQALFIYQRILETDPNYMDGTIQTFVDRRKKQLIPAIVEEMMGNAYVAIATGEWKKAKQFAQDALQFDVDALGADSVIEICDRNIPCEAVYKQAIVAAQSSRWRSVSVLLQDIRKTCPDYGDPSRLLPINSELIRSLDLGLHLVIPTETNQTPFSLKFDPSGHSLATGFRNDRIQTWAIPSGKVGSTFSTPEAEKISNNGWNVGKISYSYSGEYFASISCARDLQVWRYWERHCRLDGGDGAISAFDFSRDEKRVVTGSNEGLLKIWLLPDGSPTAVIANFEQKNINFLSFLSNENTVLSSANDGKILIWDVKSNTYITLVDDKNDSPIVTTLSKDRNYLATGTNDGFIHLWDLASRRKLIKFKAHEGAVRALSYAPDNSILISGGGDRNMKLWQVPEGIELAFKEHPYPISALDFSHDGTLIASACNQEPKINIWGII
ncbi:MAG: TIR domain-containing protein [Anaerolineaceae bacterium]|nr:TIR domain-containing protein [Anaerolineaceae bacterium]